MAERCEASFITTTSYGSWLPGDVRGYVEDGVPPSRYSIARGLSDDETEERDALHDSIVSAIEESGYRLSDLVVEANSINQLDHLQTCEIETIATWQRVWRDAEPAVRPP